MSEKLLFCPFCGGEACVHEHIFVGYSSTFGVVCLDCCAETRQFHDTETEAIAAWNRRSGHPVNTTAMAQPENNPLTLDELRQMDGEPVWVVTLKNAECHPPYWAIVSIGYKRTSCNLISSVIGDSGAYKRYGKTWLAYRSKPKEE